MKLITLFFNILSLFNFNSIFNQEKIYTKEENTTNVVAVNESSYVTINSLGSFLNYENIEYDIFDEEVYKTKETINNIYLVVNKNSDTILYIFNKYNKQFSIKNYENTYIENIYEYNDSLYLIGSISNNGLILNITLDGDLLNKRIFYSDKNMLVNHLIFDDGFYYITIYKDGITNNSEFINHGNCYDKKSIIVKLDKDYKIIKTYYLDEGQNTELVRNFYIHNNKIQLLLQTNKLYYVYSLSKELDNPLFYKINSNDDLELLIHYKTVKGFLLLNKSNKSLVYCCNQVIIDIYKFTNLTYLFDYQLINGSMFLYGIDKEFCIYKVDEYEILKQDSKLLNYFYLDYHNTSNIKVESWFSNLDIKIGNITPYFDISICGTYEINYKVYKDENLLTTITVPLIVEEYTNFIDNGIYSNDKIYEFFGTAKLNGETIYNGTVINSPGEYDIEITSVNKEVKNYHIYVVDNYYKEETIYNLDCITTFDNFGIVKIDIKNLVIENVIVNNHIYDNYKIIDNILYIYFDKLNTSVCSYYLNGITIYENNELNYYDISEQLIFNFLKVKPYITLNKILYDSSLNITSSVEDYDKTFMYFKIVTNSSLNIVTDSISIKSNNIKIYINYELGDGVINEFLLCEIEQENDFNTNIIIKYDSGSMSEFLIDISIDKKNIKILNINDVTVLDFYKNVKNVSYLKPIIIISISIFGISIVIFVCYLIVRKRKENRF